MREIRIWINSEDSINLITKLPINKIKKAIERFKYNTTDNIEVDLTTYLRKYFTISEITIIPREVEELNYNEI